MSEDDGEVGPTSLWNQLFDVFFDHTDSAVEKEITQTASDPDQYFYRKLIGAQALWMVLALILLVTLEEWSPTMYYILVFNGLLCVRLVFAPPAGNPQWWRRLNWIVYGGFIVLFYIIATEFMQFAG